jgi:hypothetical protein
VNINVRVFAIQFEQSNVYLYVLKDYESLLWMVGEEQCFLKLLRTSSNEKFWAFLFFNNPMCIVYLLYVLKDEEFYFASLVRNIDFKSFWELQMTKSLNHLIFYYWLTLLLLNLPLEWYVAIILPSSIETYGTNVVTKSINITIADVVTWYVKFNFISNECVDCYMWFWSNNKQIC